MVPTLRGVLAPERDVDPFDPVVNVRAGVRYLGSLVDTFSNVELALVAYNAGPAAVRRHLEAGGIPERLRAYPRDVLRAAVRLWPERALAPSPAPPYLALAAAHGAPPPLSTVPGGLAAAGERVRPERAALPGCLAGRRSLALAVSPPAPEAVGEPPRVAPWCGACVSSRVGLPMSRGRHREVDRVAPLALAA